MGFPARWQAWHQAKLLMVLPICSCINSISFYASSFIRGRHYVFGLSIHLSVHRSVRRWALPSFGPAIDCLSVLSSLMISLILHSIDVRTTRQINDFCFLLQTTGSNGHKFIMMYYLHFGPCSVDIPLCPNSYSETIHIWGYILEYNHYHENAWNQWPQSGPDNVSWPPLDLITFR